MLARRANGGRDSDGDGSVIEADVVGKDLDGRMTKGLFVDEVAIRIIEVEWLVFVRRC